MTNEEKIDSTLICSSYFVSEGIKSILSNSPFSISTTMSLEQFSDLQDVGEVGTRLAIIAVNESMPAKFWWKFSQMNQCRKIVFLANFDAESSMPVAFLELFNGVVDKEVDQKTLIDMCQIVMDGRNLYSLQAIDRIIKNVLCIEEAIGYEGCEGDKNSSRSISRIEHHGTTHSLSRMEVKVLECLGSGLTNKIIAKNFNLAESTVKLHVRSILRKIQTRNRTQAALWARDNGIGRPMQ